MPLLVTGGTGYLGEAVVRALSEKYAVRLLIRDQKRAARLQTLPQVSFVEGDVRDRASLKEAVKGCEGVFHLAALVKSAVRPKSLFDAVNVEGFQNLAEAAWKEGVKQLVYTSSFIALGPTDTVGERIFHNAYESSKTKALALARDYQRKGYPLITVVPTVLYGPGPLTAGNHTSRLVKALLAGCFPGWIDGGKWRWNFAYVDDVAKGHRLAFEMGKTGEEYLLGGETVSLRHFFTLASQIAGCPVPKRELSLFLLRMVALYQEFLANTFSREPSLTLGVLSIYRHDWAFQDEKSRKELGYATTPLREALEKTVQWLKEMS